eukprot:m.87714 g.87714  ORF g.87714 m.87714 type:complete len:167 (+) comp13127_c0_seq3:716-1216(+)
MWGPPWLTKNQSASDRRRGFARSDDGGATWSAVWFLEDRQPDIYVGTCSHALVSSVDSLGSLQNNNTVLYYVHPGSSVNKSLPRANYTVHRSYDGGASWQFYALVYPELGDYIGRAGYSDAHILPSDSDGVSLGVAFHRTLYDLQLKEKVTTWRLDLSLDSCRNVI